MTQPKTRKRNLPDRAHPRDIAIVRGPTEDGQGKQILRVRDGNLTAGELRPMKEGQPITGELVRLHPLDATQEVCAVEVLHASSAPGTENAEPAGQPTTATGLSRPARVATDRYRKNWGTIFTAKSKASLN